MLVVFCFYSNIKPSSKVILQLNPSPAATTSVFMKEFLLQICEVLAAVCMQVFNFCFSVSFAINGNVDAMISLQTEQTVCQLVRANRKMVVVLLNITQTHCLYCIMLIVLMSSLKAQKTPCTPQYFSSVVLCRICIFTRK